MTHFGTQCFRYLWKQQLQNTTYSFSCSVQISSKISLEAGLLTLSTMFLQITCRSAPIEMLKSTAQPYSWMQYLPKVQMISVKEVPIVSKFISWYTLTSLYTVFLAQKTLIWDTARFCRNSLYGSSNFFSKMRSSSPLAYHFKLLMSSAITYSCLIRYKSMRFTRIRILNICVTVCFEASTFARQSQFYGAFRSSTKSFNSKLTRPDFLRQRRSDFWMGQSCRWASMLDYSIYYELSLSKRNQGSASSDKVAIQRCSRRSLPILLGFAELRLWIVLQQSCHLDKNHKFALELKQYVRRDMTSSQFVVITSVLSKLASFYTELSNHCMMEFANPPTNPQSQNEPNPKETTVVSQPKLPHHDSNSHHLSSSPQQKQPSPLLPTKKKGRPKKQPAPKIKASTSYYLFFQQNKQRVAAKYNISNMKDLATMLSKEWKCLTQSERAKYQQRAMDEQNQYREGMNFYRKEYQAQPEQQRKKATGQDDPKPQSPKQRHNHHQISRSSSSDSSSSSSSSSIKPSPLSKAQVIFIEDSSQSSKKEDSLQL